MPRWTPFWDPVELIITINSSNVFFGENYILKILGYIALKTGDVLIGHKNNQSLRNVYMKLNGNVGTHGSYYTNFIIMLSYAFFSVISEAEWSSEYASYALKQDPS